MSFVSISFAALYLVALALRLTLGRDKRATSYLGSLYALSLVFYGWHVPAYLLLILGSTAVAYFAALGIASAGQDSAARRAYLVAALGLHLAALAYFKYAGLLLETAHDLARLLGMNVAATAIADVVLPVGISFYTFQSMSYAIDVYRRRIEPVRSFWRLGLYISFFPQLVAGPIVRAGEFLYQLARPRQPRLRVFGLGAYLILRGLFLKIVVADNLGALVDDHWKAAANPEASPYLAISMMVFFSCQLFCDFAGYSDIARGVAYQLGFRLPLNFDAPYIATSFQDFWRRWHISLSQWMRDYVYISLGGGRRGAARGYVNLVLVMLISGLWHGANWTFVAWGGLHGLAAAGERAIARRRSARRAANESAASGTIAWSIAGGLAGLLVVQGAWVASMALFRAESMGEAVSLWSNAASWSAASRAPLEDAAKLATGWWFTVPVWALHLRSLLSLRLGVAAPGLLERAAYSGAMLYALLTMYATTRGFIYFQF